ncbi:MarR family transcriptional regulator [Mesorhizobium sp. YR577]|uniref:MarR family winged helix-turn-helix transcriptional regulator n=1 Tax=Mesorhizobium sp. YR577 TaxID=1884373 RepID=UPI000B8743A0|nr:MarR family transcriptional regulator [Mesorhizobium sp. YR577]
MLLRSGAARARSPSWRARARHDASDMKRKMSGGIEGLMAKELRRTAKTLAERSAQAPSLEGGSPIDNTQTPHFRSLNLVTRSAHRELLIALQNRIADKELTVAMSTYLRCLWEKDGVTQRELAKAAQLVEGTTTDTLKKMENSGLIVRVRNKQDIRKINIYLTVPARRLYEQVRDIHMEIDAIALRGLSGEDISTFKKVIDKMTENLAADNMSARDLGGELES